MTKERLEAERLIYKVMDILDPSGKNKEFWQEEFGKMSDKQFTDYFKNTPFPLYFQTQAWKEPSIEQISSALDAIKVPFLESVYLPFKYRNADGKPIKSKPCMVLYIHMKRMKQLLTKKNGMSIDAKTRDMRTGLLTGIDKNGKESDREFESFAVSGLDACIKEFSRSRADSMNDKSIMNNTIKSLGQVKLSDLPEEVDDSLSKVLLNAYLIGSQLIATNLVMGGTYTLPYTAKGRDKKVQRID